MVSSLTYWPTGLLTYWPTDLLDTGFWLKVLTDLSDGSERGDTLLHQGTASLTTEPDRFLLGELRS